MCKNDPIETIERGKYRIDIYPDMNPSDPLEDCDGYYPMIVKGGRNFNNHDYGDLEDALMRAMDKLQPEQMRALAATLDNGAELIAEAEEDNEREDYDTAQERELAIADDLSDAIRDLVSSDSKSEALDTLEAIADFLTWPCLNTCSQGYSQGDYVDVLVCWTPDFGKNFGVKRENVTDKDMKATLHDWSAWAWGSVYGYTVTDTETEEQIGSCWGFYGYEHEKSGLMEAAEEDIRTRQHTVTQEHIAKVKAWTRHHVPMEHRTAMPRI